MRKNYAIDMAFEFVTEDDDPITSKNLPALVEAAKARLDRILEAEDLEAFGVFDVHEEE